MVAGGRGAASGTWRARLLVVVCVALVAWSACTAAAVGAAAEGEGEAWLPCDAGTAEFLPLPELLCAPRYAVHVRIAEDEVPSGVRAEERGTGGVAALLQGLEMAPGLAAGQEVEMVHDGMRFRCSVPAYPAVLRSVHPRQELRLRGPGEGLLHHPLDRDEMLLVDDLLAPMQNNCYFQTVCLVHILSLCVFHNHPSFPSTQFPLSHSPYRLLSFSSPLLRPSLLLSL